MQNIACSKLYAFQRFCTQRFEIGEYSIANLNTTTNTGGGRVLTSSNNSTVLRGGPYLHYTTIPRRLRPLSKVSCIYVFLSVCI